jgi:DNA modification methylase
MIPIDKIIQGNALAVLKTLPDECVNMCVTSPPYWGLRDYGIEPAVWDGELGCEYHEWAEEIVRKDRGAVNGPMARCGNTKRGVSGTKTHQGNFCQKCGAWRGSLGLEPTPEL